MRRVLVLEPYEGIRAVIESVVRLLGHEPVAATPGASLEELGPVDAAVTTSPTEAEARELARALRVRVSLDGRYVRHPERYWVFYRNNGPQICRIYFPGDLGSLHMGANSMVFRPLPPGRHRLRVELRQEIAASLPAARLVADYHLRVLPRGPSAAERALAPDEEGPPPPTNRVPLTFRNDHPELLTSGH